MEERINMIEQRVANIEGIVERIEERFNRLEARLDSSLNELRSQMSSQFRWIIGGFFLTWATIIGSVIAIVFTRGS